MEPGFFEMVSVQTRPTPREMPRVTDAPKYPPIPPPMQTDTLGQAHARSLSIIKNEVGIWASLDLRLMNK